MDLRAADPSIQPHPSAGLRQPLSRATNLLVLLLLLLAAVHCARAIFFDNVSYIDLARYSQGQERNPFQSRPALMPLLRFADSNHAMQRVASYLESRERQQIGRKVPGSGETMTPMKLACVLVGTASILAAVLALAWLGRAHFASLWWLPPALLLAILFASFAAREEQAYWYPWDLPHMLLFGGACLCILSGRYWWMLLLFTLDIPFRETSIYLIPLSLSLVPWKLSRRNGIFLAIAMGAIWLGIHEPIVHHFASNKSEVAGRLPRNLENLFSPIHVAQVASALGFLLIPVYLGRRYLAPHQRAFLWWAIPCLLVTGYYGIWIETRITVEWTIPFALLAATEFAAAWSLRSENDEPPFAAS